MLTAASELTKPLSLVSRCIDAGDGLVLGEVAAVAGQLMPSTAARGYSRIHLINIGHLDEASRLAELIGKNPGTTRSWLSNCEGRGRIAYLRKNYSAAAFAYRESHRADPTRAIPTAFWVLNSLAAGDTAQAVEAVAAFESAVEHKEWSPVEFLACQGGQDRTKRSPSTRALGLHVAETAGTSGRQLINEILR